QRAQHQHAQPVRHRQAQLRQANAGADELWRAQRLVVRRSLLLAERLGRNRGQQEVSGQAAAEVRGMSELNMATITTRLRKETETLADLLEWLGGIPPERVWMHPFPGTATEEDLIAILDGPNKRICELVDGVLVEK